MYQQMQKILRYAYGTVLLTINRYFTYFEAVNLEQILTVTVKLKWHFNYTHLCMTSHFSEVMFSRTRGYETDSNLGMVGWRVG